MHVLLVLFSLLLPSAFARNDVLIVKMRQPPANSDAALRNLHQRFAGTEDSGIVGITPTFRADEFTDASLFPADRYLNISVRDPASRERLQKELQKMPDVESVSPDYELSDPSAAPGMNDPRLEASWYFQELKVNEAWRHTHGEQVIIADIESGFDTAHPDLKNQIDLKLSHDYDPDSDDPNNVNDNDRTHGTPVCGIVAAEANNGSYSAGISFRSKIIASQIANSAKVQNKESLWTVNAARAILGSLERGANVILVEKQVPSLMASVERVPVIYDAIVAATKAGVPVIVPAGNFGVELKKEAQLADSGAIVVGATTTRNTMTAFTNYGKRISIYAPGESVYSVQEKESETFEFGGTSSAAAVVAGITALMRSVNANLAPRDLRSLLYKTGKGLEEEAWMTSIPWRQWAAPEEKSFLVDSPRLIQAGPAVRAAMVMY